MTLTKFRTLPRLWKMVCINSLVMLVWWIIFYPGFYSLDSFAVIDMAKQGPITSDWTAIWPLMVKLLTFNGSHPAFATLIFSQIFSISLTLFANEISRETKHFSASIILSATPVVGAMGVTLWHDIPMTSGFFLILTGINGYRIGNRYSKTIIILGVFLLGFRFNGVPTFVLAVLIFLVFFKNRKPNALLLLSLIVFGIFFSTLNIYFSAPERTQSAALIEWMRYDIACFAGSTKDEAYFANAFNGNSSRKNWESDQACTWFISDEASKLRNSKIDSLIPSAWIKLLKKDPGFILETHLKRNSYLIPFPIYGLQKIPFIHSTIELSGKGISFLNPTLVESVRNYPRAWNYFNFIFGYSGLWLFVIFAFAIYKKNQFYFQIGIVGAVLNVTLFIVAVIPDGRFSLFVIVVGQLILLSEIAEILHRKNARDSS